MFSAAASLVSINPAGSYDHPSEDTGALASSGFRRYWDRKSRRGEGPQQIDPELRILIDGGAGGKVNQRLTFLHGQSRRCRVPTSLIKINWTPVALRVGD